MSELEKYKIHELNLAGLFNQHSGIEPEYINILYSDNQVTIWLSMSKGKNFRSIFIKFNLVCYQFNLNESSLYLMQDNEWNFIVKKRVIIETMQLTLLCYINSEQDNTEANVKIYGVETIYQNVLIAISLIRAQHETINPKFFDYGNRNSYIKFVNWFINKHSILEKNDNFLRIVYDQSNKRKN